jgi:Fe2+ transport system protein B
MALCLNTMDVAEKRGFEIDVEPLNTIQVASIEGGNS